MITAFAECLAGESKRAAFSPPFYPGDRLSLLPDAETIAREQGIHLWFERNQDIPEDRRVNWWVMYKFPEALEEYRALRNQGYNPAWHFDKFRTLLGYGTAWGENWETVIPRMRQKEAIMRTVSRILLKPGEWPPEQV